LADVFDALGSRRSYKEPWSEDRIADTIREGRGTHFQPELVDLLLNNLSTFSALRLQYPDEPEQGT
jgi:response regulator RpfG family c-di-GMP phosphodiesterase